MSKQFRMGQKVRDMDSGAEGWLVALEGGVVWLDVGEVPQGVYRDDPPPGKVLIEDGTLVECPAGGTVTVEWEDGTMTLDALPHLLEIVEPEPELANTLILETRLMRNDGEWRIWTQNNVIDQDDQPLEKPYVSTSISGPPSRGFYHEFSLESDGSGPFEAFNSHQNLVARVWEGRIG